MSNIPPDERARMAAVNPEAAEIVPPTSPSIPKRDFETTNEIGYYQLVWRRFRGRKLALVSISILALIIGACFILPSYLTIGTSPEKLQPPSLQHLFGTDEANRDLLVRTLQGGQISLEVGFLAMLATILVATVLGAVAGFLGGVVDAAISSVTNFFLAVPGILILIVLVNAAKVKNASVPGSGGNAVTIIIVGIAVISWPPTARIVRSVVLSLREKEFVEAAEALGTSQLRIISRHIIPNALGPIIVSASLTIVAAILTESAISFLGVGIQAPIPTWGSLLDSGRDAITSDNDFWYAFFPGFFILVTAMCFNYVGDALRDAFDPRALDR